MVKFSKSKSEKASENCEPELRTIKAHTKTNRFRGSIFYTLSPIPTVRPNTRTTQIFMNFRNNKGLDAGGFAPFARLRNESLAGAP